MEHKEREGYWQGVWRRGKLIGLALLVYAAVGNGVFLCLLQRSDLSAKQAERLVAGWYSNLSGVHSGEAKEAKFTFAAIHAQWIARVAYGRVGSYYVESVHSWKGGPSTVRLSVLRRDRLRIEKVEVYGDVINRVEIELPLPEARKGALRLPTDAPSTPQMTQRLRAVRVGHDELLVRHGERGTQVSVRPAFYPET
ncbi:MAG: hypothetical protein HND42_07545 [Armatimonadetes bacterium]|nr:hypothetical protein [Armatimonadota bacterium]NOG93077.1 hypothetical protein [Armatimonadota bacterium]